MKLTRNSLKELIRQSIEEIDFKDKEAFKKYDKKHKMRADTKVNIGGKDTTVGQAIDVGGPSHANVPEKGKKIKSLDKGKPTSKTVKTLNKANDGAAKDLGFKDSKALVMGGGADDIDDFINHHNIPDYGQNWDSATRYLDDIYDVEMGLQDEWKAEEARKQIFKLLSTPTQDKPSTPGVSDAGEGEPDEPYDFDKWEKDLKKN